MKIALTSFCTLICFVSICSQLNAATAVSFSLPQLPAPSDFFVNGTDGFDFIPDIDITVTALGWYDHDGNGFLHDHPVGIYHTLSQTLVTSAAIITSASPLDPITSFRFEEVAPFTLLAGTTYSLTGFGQGPVFDPYILNPSGGLNLGPNITFIRARSGASSGLQFPTSASQIGITQVVYNGANFRYVTTVPEPRTISILALPVFLIAAQYARIYTIRSTSKY